MTRRDAFDESGNYISAFDLHGMDDEWHDRGDEVYESMLNQYIEDGFNMSQDAQDLLYAGWFDPLTESADRQTIWLAFFIEADMAWEDFDWDTWRGWYDEV